MFNIKYHRFKHPFYNNYQEVRRQQISFLQYSIPSKFCTAQVYKHYFVLSLLREDIIKLIFNMLLKWSQKEDQELTRIVRKFGTTDWALIRKHFKSKRSRDSVIKRWHGKLKFEKPNQDIVEKEKNNKAPPPIRKTRQSMKFYAPKNIARPINPDKNIKAVTHTELRPNTNKFQRLRSSLQESNPIRSHGTRTREVKKVVEAIHQSASESSQSDQDYEIEWTKTDDDRLRSLVLNEGITNWLKLAGLMKCTQKEVKKRWKHKIYHIIKLEDKVGGFLKYSTQQDAVLSIGRRNGLQWSQIMTYLPGRSQFSIEARYRRLARPQMEVDLNKNRHFLIRQILKKIVLKKNNEKEPYDPKHEIEISKM